jgi:hypothetical protein
MSLLPIIAILDGKMVPPGIIFRAPWLEFHSFKGTRSVNNPSRDEETIDLSLGPYLSEHSLAHHKTAARGQNIIKQDDLPRRLRHSSARFSSSSDPH